MKNFGIPAAALSLAAMALLSVGASAAVTADDAPPPMPPAAAEETTPTPPPAPVVEDGAPAIDLVFCIDMMKSPPVRRLFNSIIVSLIRHEARQNPGRKLRVGLVRYNVHDKIYSDAEKKEFFLDLTSDEAEVTRALQFDKRLAPGFDFISDVIKNTVERMQWSQNSVRILYVVGSEVIQHNPRKKPVPMSEALSIARESSVTISSVYAPAAGSYGGTDFGHMINVDNWFRCEWKFKSKFMELARLGGGEFIQPVSDKGGFVPGSQPLLAVAWNGETMARFSDYLAGQVFREKFIVRAQMAKSQRPERPHYIHSIVRFYEMNPQGASYLLRP